MLKIVKVTSVDVVGDLRLRVRFSDGSTGVHDFGHIVAEAGSMVEPLRNPHFFRRVFVSMGVLAWPNGYDLDAIQLHAEMGEAGELTTDAAE